jgi:Ca2+-binding RTX toxin-like protein
MGDDTMRGGMGADTYVVNSLLDVVIERADQGYDWIKASVSYTLGKNIEALALMGPDDLDGTGNALANRITGTLGVNRLLGMGGNDILKGFDGNDVLKGQSGSDMLAGGLGDDRCDGGRGRDVMYGSDGNDVLFGRKGADELRGDDGDDILDGGTGADLLRGGAGSDQFLFRHLPTLAANADTVARFKVNWDRAVFDDAVFTSLDERTPGGPLEAGQFVLGPRARDGDDHVMYNRLNGRLFYDADGVGGVSKVLIATLPINLDLTANDIYLI